MLALASPRVESATGVWSLGDQAVAPLSKCAHEPGLTERAKASDVVVDEVHVQRHHVPAKELAGSLFVARSGGPPFKRCRHERLAWRLPVQVLSDCRVVRAHLSAAGRVEEAHGEEHELCHAPHAMSDQHFRVEDLLEGIASCRPHRSQFVVGGQVRSDAGQMLERKLRSGYEQLIGAWTRQAGARLVAAEQRPSALDEVQAIKRRKTAPSALAAKR